MSNLAIDILEKGKIDIKYGVAPITRLAMSEPSEAFIKQIMTFMKEHEYHEYEWLSAEDLKVLFPTIHHGESTAWLSLITTTSGSCDLTRLSALFLFSLWRFKAP